MTFIELVKILQSQDSGVGPWHVKPFYHHRNNANGKDQTDIIVVALQPPKQEFARLGSTWLRVGKYEPAYVDRPNQWSKLNWQPARDQDWTDPGGSSLWSDAPMEQQWTEEETAEYYAGWPFNLEPDARVAAGLRIKTEPAAAAAPQHFNINKSNNNANSSASAAEPDAHQQQINQCFRDKRTKDQLQAQAVDIQAVQDAWGEQSGMNIRHIVKMSKHEEQLKEQKAEIDQIAKQHAGDKQGTAAEAAAAATLAVAAVAPDVRAAIAASKDAAAAAAATAAADWATRIEAIKAEATAHRDKARADAHDLEVRLSTQTDGMRNEIMSVIAHNAKMAQEQRQADSDSAGRRMDEQADHLKNMFEAIKGMQESAAAAAIQQQAMTAAIERLVAATPPPKRDPQKAPRVSSSRTGADAVAVVENARVQTDAGAHAPAGM